MKKYLLKLLLFFGIVIAFDISFGIAMQYMNDHSKGGGIKSRYYVCKESNENVLIFGSSRAKHHYVPNIIEDSLSLSCYNTGEDGNGIILSYGFLKMITQRYQPRFIVYDVSGFDIYEDDNTKYLDLMKPYYREPGIDSIFWEVNPKSRIMMFSNLYRYNTTCLRVVGNYLHPMTTYEKGYLPLFGTMNDMPVAEEENNGLTVDSLKLYYFKAFIQLAKHNNIDLICCASPSLIKSQQSHYYSPIEQLCEKEGIPFYNYGGDTILTSDLQLFQDRTHMNNDGAKLYTSLLMNDLNNNYIKQ